MILIGENVGSPGFVENTSCWTDILPKASKQAYLFVKAAFNE